MRSNSQSEWTLGVGHMTHMRTPTFSNHPGHRFIIFKNKQTITIKGGALCVLQSVDSKVALHVFEHWIEFVSMGLPAATRVTTGGSKRSMTVS